MTDNEIIEALECHKSASLDDCKKCPLYARKIAFYNCHIELFDSLFDFINRQKAEIERLHTAFENSQTATKMWHREAELNAGEIIKLQAEVERLTNKCREVFLCHSEEISQAKKWARAEAYIEFAERLKEMMSYEHFFETDVVVLDKSKLDDLLKEMVGE